MAKIDESVQAQIQMFNTPGLTIQPRELWLVVVGPQSLALAVVYGVYRAYKGSQKPFKLCTLSPETPTAGGDRRVEHAQVMLYQSRDLRASQGLLSYFSPAVISQPSQFICKFPYTAWEKRPGNKVKLDDFYHSFIGQWFQYCPTYWKKLGLKA